MRLASRGRALAQQLAARVGAEVDALVEGSSRTEQKLLRTLATRIVLDAGVMPLDEAWSSSARHAPLRFMSDDWQPPIDVIALDRSLYAQDAEEAMLARIFELVPPETRHCVELGASDGLRDKHTARLLREGGWRGALVEGSGYRFAQLAESWGRAENARNVNARVLPETFEGTLESAARTPSTSRAGRAPPRRAS